VELLTFNLLNSAMVLLKLRQLTAITTLVEMTGIKHLLII
jgi:hypothetical protein